MSAETICSYFEFGYCKHGNFCRKRHINEKCEIKGCDGNQCNKRHPQVCKYFREYSRCKFGQYCAFDHVIRTDPVLKELEEVKNKLIEIEKEIETKNLKIVELLLKVENSVKNLKSLPNINPTLPVTTTTPCTPTRSILTLISPSSNTMCQGQASLGKDQISQLDGAQSQAEHVQDSHQQNLTMPPFKCDNCEKTFCTIEELKHHTDSHGWGCDECFICYTSKYLADLHELEHHPGTSYAHNHIPESTKMDFRARKR